MSDNTTPEQAGPHSVDAHVGARVRIRRKFLGMSQGNLADTIDLTFQQVQKYERGSNRISASKLWEIARALNTPVVYFFDGYDQPNNDSDTSEPRSEQAAQDFLMTQEGVELANAFPRIRSMKVRRRILDLVRTAAEKDDD